MKNNPIQAYIVVIIICLVISPISYTLKWYEVSVFTAFVAGFLLVDIIVGLFRD